MRNDNTCKNSKPDCGAINGRASRNDFKGNPSPKEFYAAPDNYANSHGVAKAVMTALAASLVAVLLFGGALGGTAGTDIAAQISSTSVTYDAISYTIVIPDGATGLLAVLSNAFSRQERALSPGENIGEFKNLAQDNAYTLEVVKKETFGETVYASKKLKTKMREN